MSTDACCQAIRSARVRARALQARVCSGSPIQVVRSPRIQEPVARCGRVARRVGRDVKGVHGDVVALIEAGLINRTEAGAIEFPYEAVKVEFLLQAA